MDLGVSFAEIGVGRVTWLRDPLKPQGKTESGKGGRHSPGWFFYTLTLTYTKFSSPFVIWFLTPFLPFCYFSIILSNFILWSSIALINLKTTPWKTAKPKATNPSPPNTNPPFPTPSPSPKISNLDQQSMTSPFNPLITPISLSTRLIRRCWLALAFKLFTGQ